ncbi:MAG: DUF4870 domain-containing protein [Bacteroidetes bacterium]|nr:DUF4870 domain-containing protein [Bacteroidota bacterium]
MIQINNIEYSPEEYEAEKASNSYLMSLIGAIAGLPLPIINLIATLFFYISNKKGTYFVRWHCTQALLSQFSLLVINSIGFWWFIMILFGPKSISNDFIAYVILVLFLNLTDLIATIYSAVETRKGLHVHWWFYGDLTSLICKP